MLININYHGHQVNLDIDKVPFKSCKIGLIFEIDDNYRLTIKEESTAVMTYECQLAKEPTTITLSSKPSAVLPE